MLIFGRILVYSARQRHPSTGRKRAIFDVAAAAVYSAGLEGNICSRKGAAWHAGPWKHTLDKRAIEILAEWTARLCYPLCSNEASSTDTTKKLKTEVGQKKGRDKREESGPTTPDTEN